MSGFGQHIASYLGLGFAVLLLMVKWYRARRRLVNLGVHGSRILIAVVSAHVGSGIAGYWYSTSAIGLVQFLWIPWIGAGDIKAGDGLAFIFIFIVSLLVDMFIEFPIYTAFLQPRINLKGVSTLVADTNICACVLGAALLYAYSFSLF